MTTFDYISLLLVVYFAVTGFKRGFIYEFLSLLSVVLAIYLGEMYYVSFAAVLKPVLLQHISLSVNTLKFAANTISYVIIITVTLLIFRFLITPLAGFIFKSIVTKGLDSILGIAFGFLKGVALVYVLLSILLMIKPNYHSYFYTKYYTMSHHTKAGK